MEIYVEMDTTQIEDGKIIVRKDHRIILMLLAEE
jgi:hypothetical protein